MAASTTSSNNVIVNWFNSLKTKFNNWYSSLDSSTMKIIEALAYLAVGFFVGFVFKKHAKTLMICLVFLFISLFLLDNFDVISIDWVKVRELTGISPAQTVGGLFKSYYEWLKLNFVLVISAIVGFLIGYKLG